MHVGLYDQDVVCHKSADTSPECLKECPHVPEVK